MLRSASTLNRTGVQHEHNMKQRTTRTYLPTPRRPIATALLQNHNLIVKLTRGIRLFKD